MNYTFHKRRELNDAFRSYLLNQKISEDKSGGTPMISMETLPPQACLVDSVLELNQLLPGDDRSWREVVPVFVKTPRMDAKGTTIEYYYMLNYVNCSVPSMEQAAELVASGKLFWIPGLTIKTYGKRNC